MPEELHPMEEWPTLEQFMEGCLLWEAHTLEQQQNQFVMNWLWPPFPISWVLAWGMESPGRSEEWGKGVWNIYFTSHYCALILSEINSINIHKMSRFCLWWHVVSDFSQSLSQLMNPVLYYLSPVQLQRAVTEQLWSVPGQVRNLEEQTNMGWESLTGARSSSGGCALLAVGGPWDTSITNTWLPCTRFTRTCTSGAEEQHFLHSPMGYTILCFIPLPHIPGMTSPREHKSR